MTLPVVWIPEPDADLKEALSWYENIHPDLAIRFLMGVESTVDTIGQFPLRFQVVHKRMRRAGIRRFPYGIFFEVESDRIVVMACMHGRRNPKRWKYAAAWIDPLSRIAAFCSRGLRAADRKRCGKIDADASHRQLDTVFATRR